jgi:hypothetical protein
MLGLTVLLTTLAAATPVDVPEAPRPGANLTLVPELHPHERPGIGHGLLEAAAGTGAAVVTPIALGLTTALLMWGENSLPLPRRNTNWAASWGNDAMDVTFLIGLGAAYCGTPLAVAWFTTKVADWLDLQHSFLGAVVGSYAGLFAASALVVAGLALNSLLLVNVALLASPVLMGVGAAVGTNVPGWAQREDSLADLGLPTRSSSPAEMVLAAW